MICSNCNNEVIKGNFCEKCGASMLQNNIPCPNCGKEVKKTKFCENCGFLLENKESISKSQNKNNNNVSLSERIDNKKNKKLLLPWIIALASLALVAIISVSTLYINNNFSKKLLNFLNNSDNNFSTNSSDSSSDNSSKNMEDINLQIGQIDTTLYPKIKLYININENEVDSLDKSSFVLKEKIDDSFEEVSIESIKQVTDSENLNVNFLIDVSDSMNNNNLLDSCKSIANNILESIDYSKTQAGIITFNDEVKLTSYLTDNYNSLENALSSLTANGSTALYDALILALDETDKNEGAKLIIAFTDGLDTSSSNTADDVIEKSKLLGIPIYIISLLNENDTNNSNTLENICESTNGKYISIDNISDLEELYIELLDETQNQYVITYESNLSEDENIDHEIQLAFNQDNKTGLIETVFQNKDRDDQVDTYVFTQQKEFVKQLADKYLTPLSGTSSLYFGNVDTGSPLVINDTPLRSASTIKLFIMIEVMQQIEDGVLNGNSQVYVSKSDLVGGSGVIKNQESDTSYTILELLEYMMIDSDNTAANKLIDIVGGVDVINSRIKALGCVNSQMNRKMLDTESLANGVDNYVSAYDMGTILTRIYNKQCVNIEADTYMLQLMSKNTNHEKIPAYLPRNITIYNKTGEYSEYGVENDVAIIETEKGTYVLCILTQDGNSNEQVDAIRNLSKELYYEFIK